jgi:hypothetical protein
MAVLRSGNRVVSIQNRPRLKGSPLAPRTQSQIQYYPARFAPPAPALGCARQPIPYNPLSTRRRSSGRREQ